MRCKTKSEDKENSFLCHAAAFVLNYNYQLSPVDSKIPPTSTLNGDSKHQ